MSETRGRPPKPTQEALFALDYFAKVSEQLVQMAERHRLKTMAFLFEMARREASSEGELDAKKRREQNEMFWGVVDGH
ncbi:MAG: hypothetical protein JWO45_1612 [Spartobacteria bacterium]|nr:hypothetical protein [Spartobacteria bacterium]